MKYVFTALWAIACVVILFFGHIHWSEQTTVKADDQTKVPITNTSAKQASKTKTDVIDANALIEKTTNWPQAAQTQFKQALKEKKPFKILFVGSLAQGGWVDETKQKLIDSYGKGVIKVTTHTYDVTTTDFVSKKNQLEIAAEKAQLVIFEPLLLNDNGIVEIKDSLSNITKIMDDVKFSSPESTFILQPSYPLYNPKLYLLQVNALKDYATLNKLVYLDHWTAWPATDDLKLKEDYLQTDGPNKLGNKTWSDYLLKYLIYSK